MDIKQLKEMTKELSLLYVEDNRYLSSATMQLFGDIFREVDLAEDGVAGLMAYQKNQYDLVISDINLPKMNGLLMLKSILALDKKQAIIVISAYNEVEYLLKIKEMRIEHFLTKPASSGSILQAIYQSIKNLEVARR